MEKNIAFNLADARFIKDRNLTKTTIAGNFLLVLAFLLANLPTKVMVEDYF